MSGLRRIASLLFVVALSTSGPALAQNQLELQVMGQLRQLGFDTRGLDLTQQQVVELKLILSTNNPGMSRQAKREEVRRVIGP